MILLKIEVKNRCERVSEWHYIYACECPFRGDLRCFKGYECGTGGSVRDSKRYGDGDEKTLPFSQQEGAPMWFGGVKAGKAYGSFHLMPLCMSGPPEKQITTTMKKRMQARAVSTSGRSPCGTHHGSEEADGGRNCVVGKVRPDYAELMNCAVTPGPGENTIGTGETFTLPDSYFQQGPARCTSLTNIWKRRSSIQSFRARGGGIPRCGICRRRKCMSLRSRFPPACCSACIRF